MASPRRQRARSVGPARPNPSPSQRFPALPSPSQRFPALPRASQRFPALGAITPRRLPLRSAPGPASGSAGRGAEGLGRPRVRGAGSEGSFQAPPPLALLPGRAWAAPLLSLRAGPPGLVVLNISQLRYRTVELL